MVAFVVESRQYEAVPSRGIANLIAQSITPLAVACSVLAVSPDFDIFFHTHRTYSHSLGAAGLVWMLAALVAWRFRLHVLRIATACAAAYASHVLLDWLGRDDGPNGGLMVLWPVTQHFYRSGANMFLEIITRPRARLWPLAVANSPALAREMLILGPPLLLAWLIRVKALARLAPQMSGGDEPA